MILLDTCTLDAPIYHDVPCPKLDPELPRKDVRIKQKKRFRTASHKLAIDCHTGNLTLRRAKRGEKVRARLEGVANMNEHCTVALECTCEPDIVPKIRFNCSGCFGENNMDAVVEIPEHIDEVVVSASTNTVFVEDGDYALMEIRGGTIVSSAFADRLRLEAIFKGSIFANIDMLRDCSLELHSDDGNLLVSPRNVSRIANSFHSEHLPDDSCTRAPSGHELSIQGSSFHSKLMLR